MIPLTINTALSRIAPGRTPRPRPHSSMLISFQPPFESQIVSDNAEDFKLGGRGHTTSHKRQSLRPRPVSLKVSWAKPGFGGTIALCVLNGTGLLCAS
jgi:hypothetical protein